MQQILRSYATVGVALLGAGMIAVTPLELHPPDVQLRSIQLAGVSDVLGDFENALGGLAGNLDLGAPNPLDSLPLVGGLFTDPGDLLGLSGVGNLDVYLNLITQFIQDAATIDGHWVLQEPFQILDTILTGGIPSLTNIGDLPGFLADKVLPALVQSGFGPVDNTLIDLGADWSSIGFRRDRGGRDGRAQHACRSSRRPPVRLPLPKRPTHHHRQRRYPS